MRFIRLAIGLTIVAHGVYTKEWIIAVVGLYFTLLPLLNMGCGTTSCSIPTTRTPQKSEDYPYEYEEIH